MPSRIAIGLKCMFIAQFFKTSSLKITYNDSYNSLGAREGKKNPKKKDKKI